MKSTSSTAAASWETTLGKDVMDRTKNLANDMNDFRKLANLPAVNEEKQDSFTRFVHGLGADMLKAQLSDEKERQLAQEAVEKKKRKVATILRKKVKVTDFEDGGLSVAIDQEWDTSTWSDDLIAVGCEALILIFHDDSNGDLNPKNVARKERAVYMLLKLLSRHTAAEIYIRRNIERLISKSVSKVIRSGRTCALLDLLNIVNCCKDQFPVEMSQYNFNGRGIEMMVQEARLAAILIQHMYRARRSRIVNTFIPKQQGFASEYEVRITRIALINARSSELREIWHTLHGSERLSLRKRREAAKKAAADSKPPVLSQSIGGLRGPVHMGLYYSEILLEVVNHLCSEAASKFAHGNREDVIRSQGCILLSTYLASPVGRLCPFSACILAKATKVPDSLNHILKTGCISSAVRVFKYMRLIGAATIIFKPKKKEKVQVIDVYLSTLSIVSNTGVHAAGLYRAAHGYGFLKISRNPVMEDFNYLNVLNGYFTANRNCSAVVLEKEVERILGHPDLLKEIANIIMTATIDEVLNHALYCLLTLLSSYSHGRAVAEMIVLAGSLMVRLVQLLHTYQNNDTSNLALCVLLQACTLAKSRDLLFARNISQYLNEMNKGIIDRPQLFDSIHYQRSVLVSVCMCRQGDWRLYDPQILPNHMMDRTSRREGTTPNPNPNPSGSASPSNTSDGKVTALTNAVKKAIYLDVLTTMKCPAADKVNLSVADLVVMPTHPETPLRMSEMAAAFEPKTLVSFFCHPEDPDYYESLSLDECAATCTIFEGFCAYKLTADKVYDPGLVRLMGKYLFLCKYLFMGKPMSDGQVRVLMNGVSSCGVALARLARSCTPDLAELRKDEEDAAAKVIPKATNHLPISRQSNRAKLLLNESSVRELVLARAETYLKVSRQIELTSSILFFVNTLSVNHPKLQEGTRRLQELVGVNCLQFLIGYATMLLVLGDSGNNRATKEAIEQDLYNAGTACINLLLQLKAVHGRSTSYVQLLDHMCMVLCKVTTSQEAAFLAVNEWNIFKALYIYMPSPLSGMLQEEEERIEVLVVHGDGGGQKHIASHHGGVPVEVTEESLGRMQEDIKVYKIGLHNLPASYFELVASLCKVDQAKSTCLTDGYLRRSLEKFAILFSLLAAVAFKPDHLENKEKVLSETVACLKVLSACANHTSIQKGSSNDIILSRFFHVEEMCQGIILARKEIPRSDEAVHYCYYLLAALTRDTHRMLAIVEEYDLFSMVRDEVNLFMDIPLRTAECLVAILKNATQGITSNYLHRMIPQLREPLAKIARIYPSLAFNVDEASWNMTKSLMMFKKAVDGLHTEDFEKFRVEEFIRTGKVMDIPVEDSAEKSVAPLSQESPVKTAVPYSDGADSTSLGTYMHCGISSCGSLRHMDSPIGHGTLTLSNVRLPSPHSGSVLEISKLSARQSSLQSVVQDRKALLGFIDPNLITRPDSKSVSFSPQRQLFSPPHNNRNPNNNNSKKQSHKDSRNPINLASLPNIRNISLSELPELILTRPPSHH